MKTAYITHPSALAHEMGDGHPERPDRVRQVAAALENADLLAQMDCLQAPAASRQQLMAAHGSAHIDRLYEASPDYAYVALDADTTMNRHTLTAALHAAGAAVLAAELVMQDDYKRVFCNVRPPGHHAERDQAMGFCFFNNVAVGAYHALQALGAERIAVVDFDVHHGNGTENIFQNEPRVIMVSTYQRGIYPGSGEPALGKNMTHIALPAASDGQAARAACKEFWEPALYAFKPDLIFISAGFDAHRDDQLAGLAWLEDDFRWLTERIVSVVNTLGHGRIVSMLEGGYALDALAGSVRQHVEALIAD